jgi:hypothetical protein
VAETPPWTRPLTQVSSLLVLSARAPEQRMARRSQRLGRIYFSCPADRGGFAAAKFLRPACAPNRPGASKAVRFADIQEQCLYFKVVMDALGSLSVSSDGAHTASLWDFSVVLKGVSNMLACLTKSMTPATPSQLCTTFTSFCPFSLRLTLPSDCDMILARDPKQRKR